MIEDIEGLNLETEHLEEVIESPPPAQPVVVIQYRTRGVPWYLALPLLVVVPLGAVGVYHRVTSRAHRSFAPPPTADRSIKKDAEKQAAPDAVAGASASAAVAGVSTASPLNFGPPLAENSQPIAPGSLPGILPLPAVKTDLTKPVSPAAAAPATTKDREPSKIAGSTDSTKAATAGSITSTPTPPSTSAVQQSGPQLAANTPVDATRPAARGHVSVGFTVPGADDSPFAELDISRGRPGSTANHDQQAAASESAPPGDLRSDPQPPTEEQLRQDLQAEAAEKAAELKERRDIKNRARDFIDSESQARVEDERAAFRRDLREALNLSRREAAVQIEDLCNRYGRNYGEELRNKVRYRFEHSDGKLPREAKVRVLRLYGVPEPGILDFLANEIHHNLLGKRNGPRDSNEVRIDAAKQLLNIKLSKDAGSASKALQAQRVRPAASAASE